MTHVAILGAGPAGLGAAVGLARRGLRVTLLEQTDRVGGNAGSFVLAGLPVDYGSHRFHAAADPQVLGLVRSLLGDDLLMRPRHGRIRLLGRWIHFPLRPVDLATRMHPRFAAGVAGDLVRKTIARRPAGSSATDTFASVLERGLGRTICREFYFPYARKIWGLQPEEISPIQAYKRVSAGSVGKLIKRLLPQRGDRARGTRGYFYYPREGFGQIAERLRDAAQDAGARIRFGTTVTRLDRAGATTGVEITAGTDREVFEADHVWSTIPLTTLVRLLSPAAPADVLASAGALRLRAMVLVYLVLVTPQFTEYDAHYFPGEELPFTRVSEPKNYSARADPAETTVLCAEIPCQRSDALWSASDEDLGARVRQGLADAGLPIRCAVRDVVVRRLPAAYPIYQRGYETHFGRLDEWVEGREGLLSFGRQGLYAHDNTHHALAMAAAAVDCLRDGAIDRARWMQYRQEFERHVVED
jgi:protoporphyrinogen oxidase